MHYGVANEKGQVPCGEISAIVDCARESGMDTLDTAIAYGDSEARLGDIGIQGWNVVTKLPEVPMGSCDISKWVTDAVKGSLRRLDVRGLYGLLLHVPRQLLEPQGDRLYDALLQVKEQRLARKVGASIYDPSELDNLCTHYQLDLIQAPFNLIDRRLIDSGWMTRLSERDIELHVRSAFLQGLLLMSPACRPAKFRRWRTLWTRYDDWLERTGLSALQACLRYVLSFREISKVVVGVESRDQLQQILLSADGPLPEVPDAISACDIELKDPTRWEELS